MTSGDDETVRRKAYELWESEGRPDGRHDDHWHRANSSVTKPGQAAPEQQAVADEPPVVSAENMSPHEGAGPIPTPAAKPARKPRKKS